MRLTYDQLERCVTLLYLSNRDIEEVVAEVSGTDAANVDNTGVLFSTMYECHICGTWGTGAFMTPMEKPGTCRHNGCRE